jgi:hypothetical protein
MPSKFILLKVQIEFYNVPVDDEMNCLVEGSVNIREPYKRMVQKLVRWFKMFNLTKEMSLIVEMNGIILQLMVLELRIRGEEPRAVKLLHIQLYLL